MKTLIVICLFTLVVTRSFSQQQADSTRYEYCELVGTHRAFTASKVSIVLDFGEERSLWSDARLRDEQSGKVKIFNSMVDALNYMGQSGWEFIQAYVVTSSNSNIYHWMLKRRKKS